jgi:oxygen-independent coproporphyrinogen-3 oxidase
VQSFADRELELLGRRHTARESRASIETAQGAGFETVSVDLIYALPGQTLDAWRATLGQAIALGPDHLSCYQLTVHERTVFGVRRRRGELEEMADDDQADLFFATHRELATAGYEGYEVSNFARAPKHRSTHNMKYWDHTAYLGLGPSAHSFDGARRWWNERKEVAWRRRVDSGERPIAGGETLTAVELVVERLLLGLRTREGVDLAEVASRYGVDLERSNAELIERLVASGAVERRGSRLVPTLDGLAVADSLAAAFEVGAESGAAAAPFVPV